MELKQWWVYLLRSSADDSLYCGITTNLVSRVVKHNNGHGAKRTNGRGTWTCVGAKEVTNRSAALKEELRVKAMTRDQKLEWAKTSE